MNGMSKYGSELYKASHMTHFLSSNAMYFKFELVR